MAEYAVCRASQLYPIPEAMSFETAALVETLSIGAQAVARADVREGDCVAILGGGPIGLCSLIMARQAGARVLVSEPLSWRLTLAEDLGAEVCVNPATYPVPEAVRDFTDGYGAHVVVDATGEISAAESALSLAGPAGRVVILTLADKPMQVRPWQLVRQELTILGSRLSRVDFSDLIGLAASGKAPLERLATHRFEMSAAEGAFRAACERPEGMVKAFVLPQA
jgi:L-iditol 2-dehydrogenase